MTFLAVTLLCVILCLTIQCGFKKILKRRQQEKREDLPGISLTDILWVFLFGEGRLTTFFTRIGQRDAVNQIKIFNFRAIVINDLKLGQRLFKDPVFSQRPQFTPLSHYGVAGSSGKTWKEQRKFCSNHLKTLGVGTKSIESHIQQELDILIKSWCNLKGQRFSPNKIFYVPVLNCIWEILTGDRFPGEDQKMVELLCKFYENYSKQYTPAAFLGAFLLKLNPIRWLANFFPILRVAQNSKEISLKLRTYFRKAIEGRSKNHDVDMIPENLIGDYLMEIRKTTDPESSFFGKTGEMNLQGVIMDFFVAGGDTTATSLAWAMLHLVRNPDIQEKIWNEIQAVVGDNNRLPSLINRANVFPPSVSCPYAEAFVWEVLRISPSILGALPHFTSTDTKIGQYLFEKNSLMTLNIYSIHHDPKIWGDPENFRPERFLSDDGKVFIKNEAVIPFSVGLRRCLGMHVTLDVLFLFIIGICQKFVLKPDPYLNGELPIVRDLKSAVNAPEIYYMVAEERRS